MSAAWAAKIVKPLRALAGALAALPPSASVTAVTAAAERTIALLESGRPFTAASLAPTIQGGAFMLLRLGGEGTATDALLAVTATALNALLDDPDRPLAAAAFAAERTFAPAPLVATTDRPRLLAPARDLFGASPSNGEPPSKPDGDAPPKHAASGSPGGIAPNSPGSKGDAPPKHAASGSPGGIAPNSPGSKGDPPPHAADVSSKIAGGPSAALVGDDVGGALDAAFAGAAGEDAFDAAVPAGAAPSNDVVSGAPKPPVWIEPDEGEPQPLARFHERAIASALETAAALAMHRDRVPLAERVPEERRLLAQIDAVACAGGPVVQHTLAFWRAAAESTLPWGSWAAAFALGVLDGNDALLGAAAGLEALPPDALAHGRAAADALDLSPHPSLVPFARLLLASPHPVARAAGLTLLGRRDMLPADELRRHLLDPNPAVASAALRAASRLDAASAAGLTVVVRAALAFPHPDVAREAARALLAWGDPTPYQALVHDDRAASHLGWYATEILVTAGRETDLPRLERLLKRFPATPAHLDVVARFGHPGSWSYLLHHLADPELADAASDALVTLFGPRVDEDALGEVAAWRDAIRALRPERDVRYLFGEPWSPASLARRLAPEHASAADVAPALDEARFRLRIKAWPALHRFAPDAEPDLRAALAEITARASRFAAGSWSAVPA